MVDIIETFDKPDRQALRRGTRAKQTGRQLASGAELDDDGSDRSLVVVDTEERAAALIAADPFAKAGLFERVVIMRWLKAYLGGTRFLPA
ncbi:YciI family protein [Methylobacterium sp. NEAU K]|uniref:YciI family protein n=1 Tax=Methylobacterium sp. NEAU K TaxID=3064946 RepID=UPI00273628E7|nr:YciI family protein [Methylobacterium sp. NEAU K]MDP4001987.1 YciI family protein [Methylobacterium sp. NEAU K]